MMTDYTDLLTRLDRSVNMSGPDNYSEAAEAIRQLIAERNELLTAAEAIEINAEECLDWDDCTAMLVPIAAYHKLMEAIAGVKK